MNEGRNAFQAQTNASRETLRRMDKYVELLLHWNKTVNLVSKNSIPELWRRHFLDSAQLLNLEQRKPTNWVDLGSGGGFPGAVIAILGSCQSDLKVCLVESDQRKAAFLRTISRETGVDFSVISGRIESIEPLGAGVLSARALAPLDRLLGFAERHIAPTGTALFPKGKNAQKEIAQARERWHFRCNSHSSCTDDRAVVLSIGEIRRV